jgi:hypothetical protein
MPGVDGSHRQSGRLGRSSTSSGVARGHVCIQFLPRRPVTFDDGLRLARWNTIFRAESATSYVSPPATSLRSSLVFVLSSAIFSFLTLSIRIFRMLHHRRAGA